MGSSDSSYLVPKERLTVRLLLRSKRVCRLELFVPIRPQRRRPGRILRELLEQPNPFLPGRDRAADRIVIVSRDALVWAQVSKTFDLEMDPLELYDYKQRVRVELSVGSCVEGDVYYSAPTPRARLMDHLNGPESFVCLHDNGRLFLINKSYVELVTELPTRRSTMRLPAIVGDHDFCVESETEESSGEG